MTSAADTNITYDDDDFLQSNLGDSSSSVTLSVASSSLPAVSGACIRLPAVTYIPALATLPGTNTFAAILSSISGAQSLSIFDASTAQTTKTFTEHTNAITGLRSVEKLGGNYGQRLLLSSSRDGTVKVWDARVQSSSATLTGELLRVVVDWDSGIT